MDETLLRTLIPTVIGILVRRGADFAAAEDAVQDALVEAVRTWPGDPPRDPRAWLVAVAWRRFLDTALPRHAAAAAYLHERNGDLGRAAQLYAESARAAPNLPERDHLVRQAARLNARLRR